MGYVPWKQESITNKLHTAFCHSNTPNKPVTFIMMVTDYSSWHYQASVLMPNILFQKVMQGSVVCCARLRQLACGCTVLVTELISHICIRTENNKTIKQKRSITVYSFRAPQEDK